MFKKATHGIKEALLGLNPIEPEDDEDSDFSTYSYTSDLTLHKAAFYNDTETIKQCLKQPSSTTMLLDPQGNTALHVAVLARSNEAVELLLQAGFSPEVKNAQKWNPLDEAISMRNAPLVKMLLIQLRLDTKKERRARKSRLVTVMKEMPDFAIQLRWELGSPLFGFLLKHFAPEDTYQLYKVGLKLRIDGSLRFHQRIKGSLIPRWQKGPFSLLVDASTTPVAAALVDHTDRTWIDLYAERKAVVKDIDLDVEDLIDAGAGRVRLKSSEIGFFPMKSTWTGKESTEKVDGYHCRVFECTGKLVAVVVKKAAVVLPVGMSFDEYLKMKMPEDEKEEVQWDPLSSPPPSIRNTFASSLAADADLLEQYEKEQITKELQLHECTPSLTTQPSPLLSSPSSTQSQQNDAARQVRGTCWMATDFPFSLRQLLPLLQAAGAANKHLSAAASFMSFYKDQSLFPIKLKIPLMYTVYLMLRFRHYKRIEEPSRMVQEEEKFFEIPSDYTRNAVIATEEMDDLHETFYEAREE